MSVVLHPAPTARLIVELRALPPSSPTAAQSLAAADGATLSAWLGEDRMMVGWGEALRIEAAGELAAQQVSQKWMELARTAEVTLAQPSHSAPAWPPASLSSLPDALPKAPAAPVALGSFGFAPHTPGRLIIPAQLLLDFAGHTWSIRTQAVTADGLALAPNVAALAGTAVQAPTGVRSLPGSLTQSEWAEAVEAVVRRLQAGDAEKVVLARDLELRATTDFDHRYLVSQLHRDYPMCWTYAVDGLIGATPEMLAQVTGNQVSSRVLAGSAALGKEAQLLASAKDREEHRLAVVSVAQALAPLADNVTVPPEPRLLTLPNVVHLASDLQARTNTPVTALEIAAALHPTAAVCGVPTSTARRILAEHEQMNRGRYGGPVGWIDSTGGGEWGLALRCGQVDPEDGRRIRVFAGAGIMPDSCPATEVKETQAKMRPLLQAVGLVD